MLDADVRCPNCLRRHHANICFYCGVDKMTSNERKNIIKDRANKKDHVNLMTGKVESVKKEKPGSKPAPAMPKAKDDDALQRAMVEAGEAHIEQKAMDEAHTKRRNLKEKQKAHEATPEPKAEAKPDDDGMLSVSDIARELGLDPKAARSKLRKARGKATEGRWPKVERDSKEFNELVAILSASE